MVAWLHFLLCFVFFFSNVTIPLHSIAFLLFLVFPFPVSSIEQQALRSSNLTEAGMLQSGAYVRMAHPHTIHHL